jgi:hypothetical protein
MAAVNPAELAECVRRVTETALAFHTWLFHEIGKSSLVGRPDDCNYCPIAVFLKQFLMQKGYQLPFISVTSDIISVRVGEVVCEVPTPPWVARFETALVEQCERDHRQWVTPQMAREVLERSLTRCDFAAKE